MANATFRVKQNDTLEIVQVGPPVAIDTNKNIFIKPTGPGDIVLDALSDGFQFAASPLDPPYTGANGKVQSAVNPGGDVATITVTPPAQGFQKLVYTFKFVASNGTKIDPVILCDPIPNGGAEGHGPRPREHGGHKD